MDTTTDTMGIHDRWAPRKVEGEPTELGQVGHRGTLDRPRVFRATLTVIGASLCWLNLPTFVHNRF